MIRIGIPGMPGSSSFGTSWAIGRITARFGARLVGLYWGADLTAGLTTWPARTGGTLSNSTANRFSLGSINGRQSLSGAGVAGKSLVNTATVSCRTIVTVLSATTLPFAKYQVAVSGTSGEGLVGNAGSSAFYPYAGSTFYIDAVATSTLSAGVHVVEATKASAIIADISIGGTIVGASNQSWDGEIGCAILLSDAMSAQERTDTTSDLRRHFRMA